MELKEGVFYHLDYEVKVKRMVNEDPYSYKTVIKKDDFEEKFRGYGLTYSLQKAEGYIKDNQNKNT